MQVYRRKGPFFVKWSLKLVNLSSFRLEMGNEGTM